MNASQTNALALKLAEAARAEGLDAVQGAGVCIAGALMSLSPVVRRKEEMGLILRDLLSPLMEDMGLAIVDRSVLGPRCVTPPPPLGPSGL